MESLYSGNTGEQYKCPDYRCVLISKGGWNRGWGSIVLHYRTSLIKSCESMIIFLTAESDNGVRTISTDVSTILFVRHCSSSSNEHPSISQANWAAMYRVIDTTINKWRFNEVKIW